MKINLQLMRISRAINNHRSRFEKQTQCNTVANRIARTDCTRKLYGDFFSVSYEQINDSIRHCKGTLKERSFEQLSIEMGHMECRLRNLSPAKVLFR